MRRLLHLLTLVALLIAPLAAPAAAMAPAQSVATDCKQMNTGSAMHHMPASHHRSGEACCIAVPPAVDPPLVALKPALPLEHPIFVAVAEAFRLGAGPT
ncbi:MAG: hypothetical protein ABIN83_04695, partial [Sphingomicrobium sp.]